MQLSLKEGEYMSTVLGVQANPVNPAILGEDVGDLAWTAVGIGLSAFGNDRITYPVVRQVVPGVAVGTTGKLVDAATTGLTGYVAGEVVSMANAGVGRKIRRGGVLLGIAKVISAFVPGFSISASIPAPANFPSLAAPAAKPVNGNGNGSASLTRLGVGSMGL
jgi:hypothetical protein